jgi:predicted DCC family thiol-disulfide oxidoreductase YuxK
VGPPDGGAIVFFDGVCGLCNGLVDLLLRLDRRHVLRFAPLQGATARDLLPGPATAVDSLVVLADGAARRESEAILAILARLGGPWRLLAAAGGHVPGALRDGAYRFIAARRYRWFGQRAACRRPGPGQRGFFLD